MGTTSIKNGGLQTVRVYLSREQNFKLYITFMQSDKKKYMLDSRFEYKNQFVSKNYQETKYFVETIGLFAHRFDLDIDCDQFEVVQQKGENQKIKKTLFCKFLKTEVLDKDIYLDRGTCKTIHSIFNDSMLGYAKTFCLEKKLHNEIFPFLIYQQVKSDNINVSNNAYQHLKIINDAEMPSQVKEIIQEYIQSYDNDTEH